MKTYLIHYSVTRYIVGRIYADDESEAREIIQESADVANEDYDIFCFPNNEYSTWTIDDIEVTEIISFK